MNTKETILVTGGSGLVGNAINTISNNYIDKYNYVFISSKDYNLLDMQQTKNMFEKYNPTFVIHLAGYVGGLYRNINNKVDMLEKNLLLNFNVIKCAHDYKVKKMIACLSTCIFPDKVSYPIDESMLHDGAPHFSNDAYAYAKRMIEVHCKAYRENYGDNFICITPTNIYGPHDNFDIENGHVLPSLIHKCYLAKEKNEDFIVRGSGRPLRQFIYSEDLANLIMIILESYNDDNIILSVPEDDEKSIEYIARVIAKTYDYEHRIKFDKSYSDGQFKKTVSIQRLKKNIGDFKFTNLEEGIQKTVQWFVNKQKNNYLK
jgi:GDP-L-fucose synthase